MVNEEIPRICSQVLMAAVMSRLVVYQHRLLMLLVELAIRLEASSLGASSPRPVILSRQGSTSEKGSLPTKEPKTSRTSTPSAYV